MASAYSTLVQADTQESAAIGKVAVIGGGVSGIAAARVFLAEGADVTLFEKRACFGGVWAQNYPGYGIQVPAALYEFPDEPFLGNDFADGLVVNDYIANYARKHGVTKVAQFGTEVSKMEQVPGTQEWRLETTHTQRGDRQTLVFDQVLMATGVYSDWKKNMPNFPGADLFAGTVAHSVDLSTEMLKNCEGKHAITVGYGKSAFDVASDASDTAAKSTILFREAHWPVPRKILGLIPFEYATFNRFGNAILLPGYPNMGPIEWVLHKIPGLLTFVWWLVSQIFKLQFGLRRVPSTVPPSSFIEDFWKGAGVIPRPDFFPKVHKGQISAVLGEIATLKQDSAVLKSGEEIPCDLLVLATGYSNEMSPLVPAALRAKAEDDGLWLYRQMVHPEYPTLFFLNSQVTTFTNITTACIQARWVHEVVTRCLRPSPQAMYESIDEKRSWKRGSTPASAMRSTMVQTHQVHYYDELLKDMGASIRRKRGLFASLKECADPYRPRDYGTILTGEFKTRPRECAAPGSRQSSFLLELAIVLFQIALVVLAVKVALDPEGAADAAGEVLALVPHAGA